MYAVKCDVHHRQQILDARRTCLLLYELGAERMTDEKQTDDIGEGVGIGLGFSAGGLVCLLVVPDYLEASTGWMTFWHTVGGLLGLGGVAGVLTELSKIKRLEGAGYVAAALVIASPDSSRWFSLRGSGCGAKTP
jgi:hypothetical protein